MENKEQIFLTTLITMGIELDHELAFDVYWLFVLRGNKSSPKIDTKIAQGWSRVGGCMKLLWIQLSWQLI